MKTKTATKKKKRNVFKYLTNKKLLIYVKLVALLIITFILVVRCLNLDFTDVNSWIIQMFQFIAI